MGDLMPIRECLDTWINQAGESLATLRNLRTMAQSPEDLAKVNDIEEKIHGHLRNLREGLALLWKMDANEEDLPAVLAFKEWSERMLGIEIPVPHVPSGFAVASTVHWIREQFGTMQGPKPTKPMVN